MSERHREMQVGACRGAGVSGAAIPHRIAGSTGRPWVDDPVRRASHSSNVPLPKHRSRGHRIDEEDADVLVAENSVVGGGAVVARGDPLIHPRGPGRTRRHGAAIVTEGAA